MVFILYLFKTSLYPRRATDVHSLSNHLVSLTTRGKLTLALLCAVAFLDFVDASIINVALPSIRRDLGFSVQDLQWVPSGYLLTYGGFMLLGGRAADLLGRRRVLVAGTALIGDRVAGRRPGAELGLLVGARLAQGIGAAMMLPAALSILTTTFKGRTATPRSGVWGASAASPPPPACCSAGAVRGPRLALGDVRQSVAAVLVLAAIFRLSRTTAPRAAGGFDMPGRVLATAGMLLLVYALVKAPDAGWGSGAHDRRACRRGALLGASSATRRGGGTRSCRCDLPHPRARGRGRDAADRVRRIPLDVLLPDPLHAERPRLVADSDWCGVPAADVRGRHLRRDLLTTDGSRGTRR